MYLLYSSLNTIKIQVESKLIFNCCIILCHVFDIIFLILIQSDSFIMYNVKVKKIMHLIYLNNTTYHQYF